MTFTWEKRGYFYFVQFPGAWPEPRILAGVEVILHSREDLPLDVEILLHLPGPLGMETFQEDPREHDSEGREALRSMLRSMGYKKVAHWEWKLPVVK